MIVLVILLVTFILTSVLGFAMTSHYYKEWVEATGQAKTLQRQLDEERFPKTPKPVCLCNHGINFHDESGRCTETVRWEVTAGSKVAGWFDRHEKCRCIKYVGPEPLVEIYHPLAIGV